MEKSIVMEFYKDWQMRLIEIDLGKYEEYIYFFIEKNRAYFNAYQEQIFPFDMEYIPSLLWLLASFAETTIKIFDFVEKGAASEDEYIGTAFCTGFIETIVNIAKEDEYNIISKYFRNETLEYAAAWMKFGE